MLSLERKIITTWFIRFYNKIIRDGRSWKFIKINGEIKLDQALENILSLSNTRGFSIYGNSIQANNEVLRETESEQLL